jgi:hypothetical protein
MDSLAFLQSTRKKQPSGSAAATARKGSIKAEILEGRAAMPMRRFDSIILQA